MIAPPPRIAIAATPDIEDMARQFATLDPAEVDRTVGAHVAAAIREHRIDDAVRWQRVRLRARALRHRRPAG